MKTNLIICGDCVDIMKQWPADCIDLTVTSPPYDNLRDYKGFKFDFLGIASQLWRITKPGGVIVWVVGDATIKGSETCTSFKQAICFTDYGFRLHDTMIYQKNRFANPSTNRYHQTWEFMFIFSKGKPKTFNPIKDKKNKHPGKKRLSTKRQKDGSLIKSSKEVTINKFGMRYNVWEYNTGSSCSATDKIAYKHPAIFPEKLAADHIRSWSNEGDIVLDPMCGSGTTCKEAKKLGRQYIGIDISSEYCKITEERLVNVRPQ